MSEQTDAERIASLEKALADEREHSEWLQGECYQVIEWLSERNKQLVKMYRERNELLDKLRNVNS
jgi:hypothetical protein